MAKEKAEDKLTAKEIAENYFLIHAKNLEEIGVEEIFVTDDGVVFYNNIKGENACINYARDAKVGFKKYKNPL